MNFSDKLANRVFLNVNDCNEWLKYNPLDWTEISAKKIAIRLEEWSRTLAKEIELLFGESPIRVDKGIEEPIMWTLPSSVGVVFSLEVKTEYDFDKSELPISHLRFCVFEKGQKPETGLIYKTREGLFGYLKKTSGE